MSNSGVTEHALKGFHDVVAFMDHPGPSRRVHWRQDRKQLRLRLFSQCDSRHLGAVVGGRLFQAFGAHAVTGLDIYSMIVAVVGSVIVLVVYHAVMGNRS